MNGWKQKEMANNKEPTCHHHRREEARVGGEERGQGAQNSRAEKVHSRPASLPGLRLIQGSQGASEDRELVTPPDRHQGHLGEHANLQGARDAWGTEFTDCQTGCTTQNRLGL